VETKSAPGPEVTKELTERLEEVAAKTRDLTELEELLLRHVFQAERNRREDCCQGSAYISERMFKYAKRIVPQWDVMEDFEFVPVEE